jgi:hypothetical protein
MGIGEIVRAVIGRPVELPGSICGRFPELKGARWRKGGFPPRLGGWCLGQRSVAAITLWNTVWLADGIALPEELLLHELRHVHQFQASMAFPLLYLWESLMRGYVGNRFEIEARAYAGQRLRDSSETNP